MPSKGTRNHQQPNPDTPWHTCAVKRPMGRRGKKRGRVDFSRFFDVEAIARRVDQRLAQVVVEREQMSHAEPTDSPMDRFRKRLHDGVSQSVADEFLSSHVLANAARRLFNSKQISHFTSATTHYQRTPSFLRFKAGISRRPYGKIFSRREHGSSASMRTARTLSGGFSSLHTPGNTRQTSRRSGVQVGCLRYAEGEADNKHR